MRIRKEFFAAAILLAGAMLLSACESGHDAVQVDGTPSTAQSEETEELKAEKTAAEITAAVMAEIEIQSAIEKNIDEIEGFYDVDTSAVTDMSVYICGSGAYPDELAAFKFADGESAKAGSDAVKKRLESQIALYKDYTPDEVYKLDGAQVITRDNWVILTVCSDNSRAKEIIDGLL